MRIIVIGCGVSGLTTGIRLLDAGNDVVIWTRDLPQQTTSSVAAAIWQPFKAFPIDRVLVWALKSLQVLTELQAESETGVILREGIVGSSLPMSRPWWADSAPGLREATSAELPESFVNGYIFTTPIVEMPVYLNYLLRRFRTLGGEVEQREVHDFEEALSLSDMVVNCTGVGARLLAGDDAVHPIRGQIIRVTLPPLDRFILDDTDDLNLTYIVPRSSDCVLGGTVEEDNWSLEPDMKTAEAIWERCVRLAPEIRDCRIIEHKVGLRPGRAEVRVQAEMRPDGRTVVHNYGHGGAGMTLSWGCAGEVADIIAGL